MPSNNDTAVRADLDFWGDLAGGGDDCAQARDNRLDELSDTLPLIVETFDQVHARLTKAIAASSAEPIQERSSRASLLFGGTDPVEGSQ